MWHMRNVINVMNILTGEQMRMMYYLVNDTGILGKKKKEKEI